MIEINDYLNYRAERLLEELCPLAYHSDIYIGPYLFDYKRDTLCMHVKPRMASAWAETAYKFGKQEGVTYDRRNDAYSHDGQPRVIITRNNLYDIVRFIGDFEDNSRVSFEIFSEQPSHYEAERQLAKFYCLWKVVDAMEPVDVFRKFIDYYD
jgi:hypothetical protein